MSNKSSTSIISLPKGGGAQKGMGEKFSADLFTGTGNFTVPIAIPAGRNDLQPQLNLIYSTGNGNSPYGLGWGLGIPILTRKTSGGIPRYRDDTTDLKERDIFILSGSEDLVPVNGASEGAVRYRPRTEGLFALIDHIRREGTNHWEVRGKDGLISIYGSPKPEDAADWQDPAVISDPAERSNIFSWLLTRTLDPFGNHILYEYERDTGQQGPHHWNQLYLKHIRYIDYHDATGNTIYLVSITLHYEDRPDPFSTYRSGFEIRTRKRCTHIEVHTHADEERLVRTYHLLYLDQRVEEAKLKLVELEEQLQANPEDEILISHRNVARAEQERLEAALPLNGVSLLSQVKVVGHSGESTEELPPLEFSYSKFEPGKKDFFPLTGRDLPARSLGDQHIEMVDLFGNGLPDIIEMNGSVRYWRNIGNGKFDLPREMREAPSGLQLADPGVQMIDADGDGHTDLLVTKPTLSGYFPLRFGGLWDRRSFQRYKFAPSFNLEAPDVKLIDLDGDGVTDAIRSGSRLECFFNDPEEGWNKVRFVERRDFDEFPNVNFSDPRVRCSDMSGDGLQDIVLIYDGNVEYWPNLGYGNWGKRISMHNCPHFPLGYDPRRILIGDIDGDGLADIVYVDHCSVWLFINQSGNSWSDPIEIDGTPDVTDVDAVRLADMLGTGPGGVLWSRDAANPGRDSLLFLDFTGDDKPYLLNEMNNNLGAITRIKYAPSTRFYLEDQKRLETRWKTPLPFSVRVVSCVEIIDEISKGKLTTEYFYHHGYWDGSEREFRGFGRVDQRDTQVFEDFHAPGLHPDKEFEAIEPNMFTPPLMTRTWFHQGPVGDKFSGFEESDFSSEYWDGDPNMLERPAAMINALRNLSRPRKRDALRTFRGTILRTELYALDGNEHEARPYTVTESVFGIREESNHSDGDISIFFPHTLAQRTTQWERGDDPMTQFNFTDGHDEHGQPIGSIDIACPRGWRKMEDIVPEETPFLATYTKTEFAYSDGESPYIKDRVAKITSYELKHQGHKHLAGLKDNITNPAALGLIGQTLNYYDGAAFAGLPFKQLGLYGVAVRSESIVLTEELLQQAVGINNGLNDPTEVPPYLLPGTPPNWTDEYPQSFQNSMPELAGYTFHDGNGPQARGYFAPSGSTRFDFHDVPNGKGLTLVSRDSLGRDTSIDYDIYGLLPIKITNPIGLIQQAEYDYRVLQPFLSIDSNGNRTFFSFSPLGFAVSTAVMGKEGEVVGDTIEVPLARTEYDFFAFKNSPPDARQPIYTRTIQREYHVHDNDVPADKKENTITRVEYSDGFGRLIQTRIQAQDVFFGGENFGEEVIPADQNIEPGASIGRQRNPGDAPNVLVSGWVIYENKGQVVRQYEPFFSTGFEFLLPEIEQFGKNTEMFYDSRGQLIKTVNPDGSFKQVIFGIPRHLHSADDYIPTPWEAYTYDTNDNAENFQGENHVDSSHWNTPTSIEVNGLGHTVKSVTHTGEGEDEKFTIFSSYDIKGNLLSITDSMERIAFKYVYELNNGAKVLREESIDSGFKQIIYDAGGREIERRDSKGTVILQVYDEINRPAHLWARDNETLPMTLRQHLVYGDNAGLTEPENDNLKGKLFRHFDEAGMLEMPAYDFRGRSPRMIRRVISDDEILSVMGNTEFSHFQIDWEKENAESMLDTKVYQTDISHDALNRLKSVTYPEDVEGERKVLLPSYNRQGALQSISLRTQNGDSKQVFVKHIAYNAKKQRSLIAYGNGLMTRHAYDPKTFRLVRTRTERYQPGEDFHFTPDGGLLQDLGYEYDLEGNVICIKDRSAGSGVPNTPLGQDMLNREFVYDPLYRLVSATGREHISRQPSTEPWLDAMNPTNQDITQTRKYTRTYSYDKGGNLIELHHIADNGGGSFTRQLNVLSDSNRLESFIQGGNTFAILYDAKGNITQQTSSHRYYWNHSDRLHAFRIQAGDTPSIEAVYLYDAAGQRVKKVVRKQGRNVHTSTYIGNFYEHHKQGDQENNTLHILDNQKRIALVRVGNAFAGDHSPAIQYLVTDHLQSSCIVLNEDASIIQREEYYPYGGTSFGSSAKKRYRFTGKERDEETGLNYHSARYYAPWLMKWISADPAGRMDGLNLYRYGQNNPLRYLDPGGTNVVASNVFIDILGGIEDTFKSSSAYAWSGIKRFARFSWQGKFSTGKYNIELPTGTNPYNWTKRSLNIIWDKAKSYASNIWGWAKEHKLIAGGIAIGAAVVGLFAGKSLWNWVLAPAIRAATNAAMGYVLWGSKGAWIGAATGAIHGLAMAKAGSYDWKGVGWLLFLADNTWSLFNSFIGSIYATLNGGPFGDINDTQSSDTATPGSIYYNDGIRFAGATTLGNVTVGQAVPEHEWHHALQARLFGPFYVPGVLLSYEIATFVPYWLLFNTCDLSGIGYFTRGVYPNTLHELWGYAVEGNKCSL